jgi:formamidopyrimidine-DNA glycosylase
LIVHLRMTGRLEAMSGDNPAVTNSHVRAWFELVSGQRLVFTDQRKFGRIWLVNDPQTVIGKLGPEPLAWDFTPEQLAKRLAPRRAAMKSLLLNQTIVAGLGNIYADESLFLSGIHPLRTADNLDQAEITRLHSAIQKVLNEAIAERGTTLRDYRPAYGAEGAYQHRLRVYGQTDRPCPQCGAPIRRIRVAQRSTHFCPRCQRSR